MLVGMFRASRRGDFATDDRTLDDLLGRPSVTVTDMLKSIPTPTQ
jgi:hypothetical protein